MSAVVYIARDADGATLYVGCTTDYRRRMIDHKANSDWFDQATQITSSHAFESIEAARGAEERTIRHLAPPYNVHYAGRHRKLATNGNQGLATILLGQPIHDWIAERREAGASWRAMAADLKRSTNDQIVVTYETLRTWYGEVAS